MDKCKVIIITGMSNTGKSTLAKKIHEKIQNSTLISLDYLKEFIYDMVGFAEGQKKSLEKLTYDMYKMLVEECINRKDKFIILEYPFNESWMPFFERFKENVDFYTVNIKIQDFDAWFNKFCERELSEKRHISHLLDEYNLNQKYERKLIHSNEEMKNIYDTNKYGNIFFGKKIDIMFEDLISNKISIENILKEIIKS